MTYCGFYNIVRNYMDTRLLQIKRNKCFAGCLIPYQIELDHTVVGTINNNGLFRCFISGDESHSVRIIANTSTGIAYSSEYIIPANNDSVGFTLKTNYSFIRGSSYVLEPSECNEPIIVPLSNIVEIDEAGILYIDNNGNSENIAYYDACKGWRKHMCSKSSKPAYVCNREKTDTWHLTFYTDPIIVFYTDSNDQEQWTNTINRIYKQRYSTFDMN